MSITRRAALAAAAATLAAPRLAGAQGARMQMAVPYPDGNVHTRNIREWLAELEASSAGRVNVQLHSNGSLLGMPAIKRGVQQGQVQLGEILLTAYSNEEAMFDADAIPFLVDDFAAERQGLMLLYSVAWPAAGFYTNVPLDSLDVLKGSRFRTYSPMTNRFAALVGATPTLVQAAEIPQAFATGVVNAMVTSAATGVDTQAWDYAKYFTPIGFTFTRNCVFASRRAVEALSERDRQTLREVANAAENRGWEASQKAKVDQEAMLASKGMQVMQPSKELMDGMAAIGRTMVDEWLAKAGPDGKTLIDAYRA